MRDRQPLGTISQQEVIDATCSSAQAASVVAVLPSITPDPIGYVNPTFHPGLSPGISNIPQPSPPAPSSVLGYQPCVQSNEWYVSLPSIRCSPSFAATGFAPDPKDCSKYYSCDAYIGPDGMSQGTT